MALTPQQLQAARAKVGIQSPDPVQNRVSALDAAWGTTPKPAPKVGQGAAGEFGAGVIASLIKTGAGVEKGLDHTLGRVGNAVAGNGFIPTHTGADAEKKAKEIAGESGFSTAGDITGTTTQFLVGGEGNIAAKTPGILPKLVAFAANKVPEFAKDVAIGTAQTGDFVEGLGTGAGGLAGSTLLNAGVKAASRLTSPAHTLQGIVEALTPKLKPTQTAKGINEAAKRGESFDPSDMQSVQRSLDAIQDVANTLGKKITDVVKPGIKQAKENGARIGQTISEYAKQVVSPFVQKSGVNYNFTDLRDALKIVRPSEALEGQALSTYNKVRERILSAVSNKVSPDTKGLSSLSSVRKATSNTGRVEQKVTKGDEDFWDARKIIDSIVDEETRGKAFGDASLAGAKAAYRDMRQGFAQYLSDGYRYPGQMKNVNRANNFLSTDQVKNMDKTGWSLDEIEKQFGLNKSTANDLDAAEWEKHMSNLSAMYDAIANTTSRAVKEEGKSWLALFAKEHPALVKGIELGAGAVGAGALFEGGRQVIGNTPGL